MPGWVIQTYADKTQMEILWNIGGIGQQLAQASSNQVVQWTGSGQPGATAEAGLEVMQEGGANPGTWIRGVPVVPELTSLFSRGFAGMVEEVRGE